MRELHLFARPLLLLLPLLLASACSDKPPAAWSGYAEGDYVYIAAPLAGTLQTLAVQAGQQVDQDAALFTLEDEAERGARAEAAARLEGARAQAANTDKGKRSDEIAVAQAQLAQAQANATLTRNALMRQQQLLAQGFIAKAQVQDASTTLAQAQARVTELNAALRVARLPARADERAVSQASVHAAQEALRQSEWRTAQKQQRSPVDARVAEVFFRPGEFVPAGQAVVSLLPPGNLKARFFVPEAELATLATGQDVQLRCDGCGTPIAARISRIATQPEYTPPVIYSNTQRTKLVFMVEARADPSQATRLHPGQPLEVRPAAASAGASHATAGASP